MRGSDILVEIENYLEHWRDDKEGREDYAGLDVFCVFYFYLSDHIGSTKISCKTAFSHHRDCSTRHLNRGNRGNTRNLQLWSLPDYIHKEGSILSAQRPVQNSPEWWLCPPWKPQIWWKNVISKDLSCNVYSYPISNMKATWRKAEKLAMETQKTKDFIKVKNIKLTVLWSLPMLEAINWMMAKVAQ